MFALLLVLSGILAAYAGITLHGRSNLNAAAPYTPPRQAVVFLIDGYTLSDLRSSGLPNIATLLSRGVAYRNAWAGEFPTSPATLAASLGTGAFPARNGLLADAWIDPVSHALQTPTTPAQVFTGSIDQVMEPAGPPSFAALLKARNSSSRILSVGGVGCSAASAAATWAADYVVCPRRSAGLWRPTAVAGHALPSGTLSSIAPVPSPRRHGLAPAVEGWALGTQDRWVARVAATAFRRVRPSLTYVAFPEPNAVAPYVPPPRRAAVMRSLLRGIDAGIGSVLAAVRATRTYNRTLFALVSMRGFDPVSSRLPTSRLAQAIVGTGTRPSYIRAEGAATIGLSDPTQAQAAAQVIEAERLKGLDEALYKTRAAGRWSYATQFINPDMPLPAARAIAYLVGTDAASGSAEVVALFSPHVAARGGARGGFRRVSTGVGVRWANQAGALVIAGRGTYRHVVSSYPARIVDIAPTLEAMMGLQPTGTDGLVLADATFRPPKGAVDTQAAQAARFLGDVRALRAWQNRFAY